MKIVIAGAGAVGTRLARLFVREHHEVTLIDPSRRRLSTVSAYLDILTIDRSPMLVDSLVEADVAHAHLFVGVTTEESVNLMCCILAKKLGAKKTVARIDNAEYTLGDSPEFFRSVGIDSIVYPEMLVAKEINHLIERPWVRQWWEVQDGQLVVLGVKLRKGVSILDRPLYEICGPEDPFHITALKRAGETIIPHGNDKLQAGDVAFIMTTPSHVEYVQNVTGKAGTKPVTDVMYVGASESALHSINSLPRHIHGKLFEPDEQRFADFCARLQNHRVMPFNSDGRDLELLEDENIRGHQVFVATSDNSETNILACMAARQLGVPKTIAMVENIDYINFAESLDIGSIINKQSFAAGHIYRMMLSSDVESVKALNIAAAEVAEYHVKPNSLVTKSAVKDLGLPGYANIGGFVRKGKGYLVNGSTTFLPGDTVVVFCLEGNLKRLERFFK